MLIIIGRNLLKLCLWFALEDMFAQVEVSKQQKQSLHINKQPDSKKPTQNHNIAIGMSSYFGNSEKK